jgi:DNA-binding MurR/RpiR family transcriptional regulator
MPRLSKDTWADVRAEREAGASFGELADKYGVDKAAIVRRAKAEGWGDGQDVAEVIRRKVTEKLTGTSPTAPEKKAAAIDAAADRAAEVVRRHQEETNAARERLYSGLKAHKAAITKDEKVLAFEDLKAAKIAAEALSIIQRLERINWGLEEANAKPEIVIERSYGK